MVLVEILLLSFELVGALYILLFVTRFVHTLLAVCNLRFPCFFIHLFRFLVYVRPTCLLALAFFAHLRHSKSSTVSNLFTAGTVVLLFSVYDLLLLTCFL